MGVNFICHESSMLYFHFLRVMDEIITLLRSLFYTIILHYPGFCIPPWGIM